MRTSTASRAQRDNAEGIVAEGVGWDLVTLFLVVPATLIALAILWRGSVRALLVTAGLLAYFSYQYFQYAVLWAYGPSYPLHLLTFALAISALAVLVAGLDLDALRARVAGRFPHRAVAVYGLLVVILLLGLWLPVISGTLGAEVTDELQGATTLVVPAFDLGLLVPLGLFTALAVARRLALGYLLGSIILVKGASMALAISAMLLVEWRVTGDSPCRRWSSSWRWPPSAWVSSSGRSWAWTSGLPPVPSRMRWNPGR